MEIRNLPSVKEREFKARSKSDSHILNQNQEDIFRDILDLFNSANEIKKSIYELNLLSSIETRCYSERLKEALKNIRILQQEYDNLLTPADGFRYSTCYAMNAEGDKSGYFSAMIDKETNSITAAIVSCTAKTRLYDETYDETFVPPDLKLYIGPDSFHKDSHMLFIEDNNVYNMLDGDINSVWFRRIITDASVNEIENEVVIGLPESLITSRLVNQVIIYPFPAGWTDIMDVQYKSNGAWNTVPGFETHECCTNEEYNDIFGNKLNRNIIKDSQNIRLCFSPVQTNQLKIKLRQRHPSYDASINRKEWFIGIRDVSVDFVRYSKESSIFDMDFEFPDAADSEQEVKVYDTEITYNNNPDRETARNVFKDYYYYDDEGNTHKVPDSLPFILCGKKMKVRFTIDGTPDTPCISKCSVKYKLV